MAVKMITSEATRRCSQPNNFPVRKLFNPLYQVLNKPYMNQHKASQNNISQLGQHVVSKSTSILSLRRHNTQLLFIDVGFPICVFKLHL